MQQNMSMQNISIVNRKFPTNFSHSHLNYIFQLFVMLISAEIKITKHVRIFL